MPASVFSSEMSVIHINKLASSPILDGKATDWQSVKSVTLSLRPTVEGTFETPDKVEVKAGYFGDEVFFYFKWQDETEDLIHKPFVWNEDLSRYKNGEAREDRLAMQFEMSGSYTTDWASGNQFTADMWHWKSSRSEPHGLAHDKSTQISTEKMLKSYRLSISDGKFVYIKRPSDEGSKIYTTKRYAVKDKNVMPKYILPKEVSGSVSDVKTRALWENGYWSLEMKRVFNTGHDDDVVFSKDKKLKAGIAIFNRSENEVHRFSDTIELQFID
jgi:hypothetical protein